MLVGKVKFTFPVDETGPDEPVHVVVKEKIRLLPFRRGVGGVVCPVQFENADPAPGVKVTSRLPGWRVNVSICARAGKETVNRAVARAVAPVIRFSIARSLEFRAAGSAIADGVMFVIARFLATRTLPVCTSSP